MFFYTNPKKIIKECEMEIKKCEGNIGKYGEKWDVVCRNDIERLKNIMMVAEKDLKEMESL